MMDLPCVLSRYVVEKTCLKKVLVSLKTLRSVVKLKVIIFTVDYDKYYVNSKKVTKI